MTADTLLKRLECVKPTGTGRWKARCPSHDDRAPSLSIRELNDGRILVHDFAGCSTEEVLTAVGLTFDALFPGRPIDYAPRERRPYLPADVFDVARREIGVVAILASDMYREKAIITADYERLFVCVQRLNRICEAAYGR